MGARFDHLVIAVADLDEAAARWNAAGLSAQRGGVHPAGTENALVRGPGAAYVELITAGSDDSNPWLDRVRAARGPISWAIAVEDVERARDALVEAGFDPAAPAPGSRRTPDGELVEWRVCDIGPGPYDGSLPFLIEWTSPMDPGPADGPIVAYVTLTPRDPEAVADLLLALGFAASTHWPRRVFHDPSGRGVDISLLPIGEPEADADWTMSWASSGRPAVSLAMTVPESDVVTEELDGVSVTRFHDRRRFAAASLLPAVDHSFTRLRQDSPDQLLALRAEAWVEAITASGLGASEPVDLGWAATSNVEPAKVARLRGPTGTQPVTIVWGVHPTFEGAVVVVGIGDPVEVLERQPEWGSVGPGHELGRIDDAFVLALSGGVYAVRRGKMVVTRSMDGWGSSGRFADGEAEGWLADAASGRRTDGAVIGEPWL